MVRTLYVEKCIIYKKEERDEMPTLTRSAVPIRPAPAFREEKPLMVDFVYNKGANLLKKDP